MGVAELGSGGPPPGSSSSLPLHVAGGQGRSLGPLIGAAQPADLGTGQGLLYRPSVVPEGGGGTMGGGGSPTHVRLEGRKTAGGTFAQKKPETRRM